MACRWRQRAESCSLFSSRRRNQPIRRRRSDLKTSFSSSAPHKTTRSRKTTFKTLDIMEMFKEEALKMYFFENRLETFEGWPFDEDCSCTPEKMAKAGFIHTPSENSPDIAMCFFCLKELEGWEPEDDPQKEHKTHSPSCQFISLKKKVEELTVEEFVKLQKERNKSIIKKTCNEAISRVEEAARKTRADITKKAMGEE